MIIFQKRFGLLWRRLARTSPLVISLTLLSYMTAAQGVQPDSMRELKRVERDLKRDLRRVDREAAEREGRIRKESSTAIEALRGDIEKIARLQEQTDVIRMPNALDPAITGPAKPPLTESPLKDLAVLAGIVFASGLGIFQLLKGRRASTSGVDVEMIKDSVMESVLSLDEKLLELLSRGIEAEKSAPAATDHSFHLRVADETVRIGNYLEHIPEGTKGLKHLQAALKRLRTELEEAGYEIVEMAGLQYSLGMNVNASFIQDDSMESGRQIIKRVLRPQVNFEGKMIQMADIEVIHNA